MVTGANSLSLVREELFATIAEAEQALNQFIANPGEISWQEQATKHMQQLRGSLSLIELMGAELLTQEMSALLEMLPALSESEQEPILAALCKGICVLGRYLETVAENHTEFSELLLPTINALRELRHQPPVLDGFFFEVPFSGNYPAPPACPAVPQSAAKLRQAYQTGLIGFIREHNLHGNLLLMGKAMLRLWVVNGNTPLGWLCWLAAVGLEAQRDSELLCKASRKRLFARVDQELHKMQADPQRALSKELVRELTYLVALADSQGPLVTQARQLFGITPLPVSERQLEEEALRLFRLDQEALRSLSSAIYAELTTLKELLDLIEREAAAEEAYETLKHTLDNLSKTLEMVGLPRVAALLNAQQKLVVDWHQHVTPAQTVLSSLADCVLQVEAAVSSLEKGRPRAGHSQADQQQLDEDNSFALLQLQEARIVIIDESLAGLDLARRTITTYVESGGDTQHLATVPESLQTVRGGLYFLGLERTANLVKICADYVHNLQESTQMPEASRLDALADVLTALEYFIAENPKPHMEAAKLQRLTQSLDLLR